MIRQTVLLFGPPGSGKGTQAKRLEQRLRAMHISTGDMFRDHLSRRTELGLKIEHIVRSGQLVPDAVTNEMVRDRLLRPDVALGTLLDGFPRNIPQARWLDMFLGGRGYGLRGVVVLCVPRAELIDRLKARALKEGRADDADEAVIRRRLDTFAAQTEACLGYYDTTRIPVHQVDGVGSIDEVTTRVLQRLGA
jgi:adenylate kinase